MAGQGARVGSNSLELLAGIRSLLMDDEEDVDQLGEDVHAIDGLFGIVSLACKAFEGHTEAFLRVAVVALCLAMLQVAAIA